MTFRLNGWETPDA
jgi:predicted nucleotidyltransferase